MSVVKLSFIASIFNSFCCGIRDDSRRHSMSVFVKVKTKAYLNN